MVQIRARPAHVFSWDFPFYLEGEFLAGLEMAWLRESGRFVYGGRLLTKEDRSLL